MARRRVSAAHKKSVRRKASLRYRWKKAASKPRYAGLRIVGPHKAGKRKHHKGKGWGWTGRKGTVSLFDKVTGGLFATNPRGRRNPGVVALAKETVVSPVMALPKSVPALFKGKIIKNVAFAAGGAATALVGGTMLQSVVFNTMAKVAPSLLPSALSKGAVQRVVGASFALVAGGIVARFAVPQTGRGAFITGTAAAALVEAIFPGYLRSKAAELPVVGGWFRSVPASPVQGLMGMFGTDMLAAYVESPAYQGSNGLEAYVESPAYQGSNGLQAYVESPAYQGSNGLGASMDDAVAGLGSNDALALGAMGSNMPSHLDA
jgi:hypothetical protein